MFCDVLVECSFGRYNKDEQCVKCDFGTYQDEHGQSICKECPEGTTTPGRDSRSVYECSVYVNENSNGIYVDNFRTRQHKQVLPKYDHLGCHIIKSCKPRISQNIWSRTNLIYVQKQKLCRTNNINVIHFCNNATVKR